MVFRIPKSGSTGRLGRKSQLSRQLETDCAEIQTQSVCRYNEVMLLFSTADKFSVWLLVVGLSLNFELFRRTFFRNEESFHDIFSAKICSTSFLALINVQKEKKVRRRIHKVDVFESSRVLFNVKYSGVVGNCPTVFFVLRGVSRFRRSRSIGSFSFSFIV